MRWVVLLLMQIYHIYCNVWGQDGFGVILMGTMCAAVSITSAKQAAPIPEIHQPVTSTPPQQFFYTLTPSLQPNTYLHSEYRGQDRVISEAN